MESKTRVAIIGILVEETDSVESLNAILHEFSYLIIGRLGIPYRAKDINIISIAVDGDLDKINELTGKIGQLEGVRVKTAISSETEN